MHPCGREDIDVRMLGNGRPVALEIIESKILPTQEILDQIVNSINNSEGLNQRRDIDIVSLTRVSFFFRFHFLLILIHFKVTKDVWTTMQSAAEEKNKAYMCVVSIFLLILSFFYQLFYFSVGVKNL